MFLKVVNFNFDVKCSNLKSCKQIKQLPCIKHYCTRLALENYNNIDQQFNIYDFQ